MTGATNGNNHERVSFNRGGEQVTLYKSPNLIAIHLKDGSVLEELPGQLTRELSLPPTVRFYTRYPGRRLGI